MLHKYMFLLIYINIFQQVRKYLYNSLFNFLLGSFFDRYKVFAPNLVLCIGFLLSAFSFMLVTHSRLVKYKEKSIIIFLKKHMQAFPRCWLYEHGHKRAEMIQQDWMWWFFLWLCARIFLTRLKIWIRIWFATY